MFFEKLSLRQKIGLLSLAKRMMIADAKVRVEEDALFQILRTELGPGIDAPTQEVFGPIDVSEFDDPHSRLVLLMTLAIMAFIDDNFHPSESGVLAQVTDQIGFPRDLIAQAMDIAERQGAIVVEIENLFAKAG
ncbi:MAG: hypothetical protein RLW87_11610 [Alphaproteobacteria bacterium]